MMEGPISRSGKTERWFAFWMTLAYALAVTILSGYHELWQDEVMTWSIATGSGSLGELLAALRNYGHPPLFFLVLHFGHNLVPHPVMLQTVNLTFCIVAVYLFLLKAPFTRLIKTLFIGGVLPFYIYPVINRNYGLAMLLIFATAVLYKDRFRRPYAFAVALILLAAVHTHMLIIACAVICSILFESVIARRVSTEQDASPTHLLGGFIVFLAGLCALIALMVPDETSIIFSARSLDLPSVASAFLKALIVPGITFKGAFGFWSKLFSNVIIFGTAIYLLRKRHLAVLYVSGTVALTMFFILVYPSGALRHQGALFMLTVFTLWVETYPCREEDVGIKFIDGAQRYIGANLNAFLVFLLIIQVCVAFPRIKSDILRPFSSGKELAAFIKADPVRSKAIITAEPASMLNTLAYYIDNPLYFYRENRFGKVVTFNTANNNDATLDDLLDAARRLHREYGREILILVEEELSPDGPFTIKYGYGRTFSYTPESLRAFQAATRRIAGFHGSITGEDCDVFRFKGQDTREPLKGIGRPL